MNPGWRALRLAVGLSFNSAVALLRSSGPDRISAVRLGQIERGVMAGPSVLELMTLAMVYGAEWERQHPQTHRPFRIPVQDGPVQCLGCGAWMAYGAVTTNEATQLCYKCENGGTE
jgi:hypothetical protein